jgi:pantoate--beta-alanine ligase
VALVQVVTTAAEVRAITAAWRGKGERAALVPTMGYLHEGHLSLMREGRRRAERVAVSIFVNPLQFGPKEDLARYPRDLEGDLAKCGSVGVDLVFHPEPAEMYPPGFQTSVDVGPLSQGLCGASRPGHFRGVATVVTKLLALFLADVAIFGRKDYQQLKIIERVARDLALPSEIVGAPIVREPDGLAMSSRNAYLSPDERRRALSLQAGLQAARGLFAAGKRDVDSLRGAVLEQLEKAEARPDYVELRDAQSLEALPLASADSMLFVAAFLGKTRLIDNVVLG